MSRNFVNQPLIELNHPDRAIRGRAAISLGDDVGALQALLQALRTESDVFVREDITWSLVRMGDVALLPLIHLLFDANAAIRHHAAHTLGKIGDARAVDALILTLQDGDRAVILKAVLALGQIGDDRAVPALIDLLGSEDDAIRATLTDVLEGFGESAAAPLIGAMGDERWQAREQAAEILGILGSRESESAMIAALHDTHWQVRFAAANVLGQLGGKNARMALQGALEDADQRVRGLAAKLLKRR